MDVHRIALWWPASMPGASTHYYRLGAGAYSVRPVLIREYSCYLRNTVFSEKWALFHGNARVPQLKAASSRDECMEQAENWLMEEGIIV